MAGMRSKDFCNHLQKATEQDVEIARLHFNGDGFVERLRL